MFIFPKILSKDKNGLVISSEIIPTPGSTVQSAQAVFVENGIEVEKVDLTFDSGRNYKALTNRTSGSFFILAKDSSGKSKTHPIMAPQMLIQF